MSVTSLITHFLAYAAGMATVWLLCIVIAGGQADDWADEMAERRGPQRRAPETGAEDGTEDGAEDVAPQFRRTITTPTLTPQEREQIANDLIRALRRRNDVGWMQ